MTLDELKTAGVPESWCCVDCGVDTAPGCATRVEMYLAFAAGQGVSQTISDDSEIYCVRPTVWKKTGIEPMGGCLCVACIEQRIGRRLKPKDFLRDHAFALLPGTPRLLQRQGRSGNAMRER
jgi:hypothetical protein